jgi:hypothetical protein
LINVLLIYVTKDMLLLEDGKVYRNDRRVTLTVEIFEV